MFSKIVKSLFALSVLNVSQRAAVASEVHGAGAEGTVMGPVAFLWPEDRPWSANADNSGPCGSSAGVTNRTEFPLGSLGSIELTIASEAYDVAVRVAYGNNPTSQEDFSQIHSNVSEIDPGHQCYSVPSEPSATAPGSNATIQLEYWANDSNKNESFFACADITFVEAAVFTAQIVCFNVTAEEFEPPASTPTPAVPAATPSGDAATEIPAEHHGSSGLSAGAKAGIAVGSVLGAALILAAVFFAFRRRSKKSKDTEAVAPQSEMKKQTPSFHSGETMH